VEPHCAYIPSRAGYKRLQIMQSADVYTRSVWRFCWRVSARDASLSTILKSPSGIPQETDARSFMRQRKRTVFISTPLFSRRATCNSPMIDKFATECLQESPRALRELATLAHPKSACDRAAPPCGLLSNFKFPQFFWVLHKAVVTQVFQVQVSSFSAKYPQPLSKFQ
jgi:hypothetical protein